MKNLIKNKWNELLLIFSFILIILKLFRFVKFSWLIVIIPISIWILLFIIYVGLLFYTYRMLHDKSEDEVNY